MNREPATRLVLLPSYNSGALLARTAREALAAWPCVWVVLDGSTDGSADALRGPEFSSQALRVIHLKKNQGKGGAVLEGMKAALAAGFSHALVMDADGQHAAESIPEFMDLSTRNPAAMILGVPAFRDDAPRLRVHGRKAGNFFTRLETGGAVRDSLFGFRVYPIAPAVRVLSRTRHGRRFDFDTELAVRLVWAGVPAINHPAPVFYPPRAGGGVSHFGYFRDNFLLAQTHTRLCLLGIARMLGLWRPA